MVNTYYICFTKGNYFLYKWKLIKKGFGHIIIFHKIDDGIYYCLHPYKSLFMPGLHISENLSEKEFIEELKKNLNSILKVTIDLKILTNKKNRLFFWPFNFINCVSFTKYLCGIFNPFIQTPYQLFKYLIKHRNAVVI